MKKVFLCLFCLVPFFLDKATLKFYEPYNYFFFLIFHIYSVVRNKKTIFYPSSLFIIYITINYIIGSYFYNLNLFDSSLNGLLENNHLRSRIVVNNFFLFFTIVFSNYRLKIDNNVFKKIKFQFDNPKIVFLYGTSLLFFFSFVEFNLDFLGGDGSFSNIPKSIGAIILFIYASRKNKLQKYIIYLAVFLILSAVSYEDKREAILLVLTYIMLEYVVNGKKFKLKNFIQLSILSIFSFLLILVMSIKRGYGNYVDIDDSENIFELFSYVPLYVSSDYFLASVSNNLEISYAYTHSNRALDYAINNDVLLAGSTFVKPLFLFVPRTIFKNKPSSMIDHYTKTFSRRQRANGVSWPVNLIAEFFWNFSYFGIILIVPFLMFFDSLFSFFFENPHKMNRFSLIIPLFLINQWIVLVRGSGLEHFLLDFILGCLFIIPIFKINRKHNG